MTLPQPDVVDAPSASVTPSPPGSAVAELRTQCLGEIDPASVAKLTQEELTREVERTLAEIATGAVSS